MADDRSGKVIERRRELNRKAAQKLRNRQKEKAIIAKQDYFQAQSRNTHLNYEVKQLRKRKDALHRKYEEHVVNCHQNKSQGILSHHNSRAILASDTSGYQTFYVTTSPDDNGVALQLLTLGNLPSVVNSQSGVTHVTSGTNASTPSTVEPKFATVDVKKEYGVSGHVSSRLSMPNEASNDTFDDTSDEGSIVMEIENEAPAELNDNSLRPENHLTEPAQTTTEPILCRPAEVRDSNSEASTPEILTYVEPIHNEPQVEQSEAAAQSYYIDASIISSEVCTSNLPLAVTALCADED